MIFRKQNRYIPYPFMENNASMPYFHPHMEMTPKRNFPPYWTDSSPYPPMHGFNNHNDASSFLFQNPLEPIDDHQAINNGYYLYPMMHPYPQVPFVHKPPTGFSHFVNSFKGQNGSFDVKKMIDTASQMIYAVNQVTSMIKGLGGIFKV